MTSPTAGGLRLLRAGLLATACVSLALAAHTSAGGHAPGAVALLTAGVAVGCGALLVTGRRLGSASTVVGLVGVQAALHLWFALTSGHDCAVTGALTHVHGVAPRCAPLAGVAPEHAATPAAASAAAMLLAHLGAVVLLGLLLAHADALLWRLAGLLPRPVPATTPPVVRPPWRLTAQGRSVRPAGRRAPTAWPRRGPPQVTAAR
ncbi:MAG TPA: hypothetical protein VHO27_01925 [Angustibacter sp.]|nr:hypothetical protein [Angustibacter sp.]